MGMNGDSWQMQHCTGYLAHGTATDYMHDILGVPFSFTWEIFGDVTATFNDCFRMFNPLTKEHLDQVQDHSILIAIVLTVIKTNPLKQNTH